MCTLFLGLVCLVFSRPIVYAAEGQREESKKGVERSVVIPEDNTSFKVEQTDTVRLTGKGIAGAKITVKIDGPAKLVATNRIFRRRNGNPLIGLGNKEIEIKPTGKGTVKVTITSTPPQPDEKPTVEKYQFEVE
jgi:hypothetical protein